MKKRAAAAVMSVLAAGSLLLAAAFSAPKEQVQMPPPSPPAIVQLISGVDAALPDEDFPDAEQKKRGGFRAMLRAFFLRLPLAVRLALVPLLTVGQLLIAGAAVVWGTTKFLWLGTAIQLGMLVLVFALLWTALFPDKSLREFFTVRTLLTLVLAAVALAITDMLIGFLPDKQRLIWLAAGLLCKASVVVFVMWRLFRSHWLAGSLARQ